MYTMTLLDVAEEGDKLLLAGWFLKEGDAVSRGQDLLDVETDKAAITVPSPVSGKVVRLLVAEGEEVKRETALCEIEETEAT